MQKPSRLLPPPEKHRSETDLRQEEAGDDRDAVLHAVPTRSESTTRLPYKKPTTIGSTDDILAVDEEEETKKRLRLKKFFESTTSGPKSLPQSMTTAHQEMKAQLAAMQQQHQNSMRRQRHLSGGGGGAKREVNTQTTTTVLHETDLDAVVPAKEEPLKSALKQSAEGGGAVPKQMEVASVGEKTGPVDTTQEDGTMDQVGSDEQ